MNGRQRDPGRLRRTPPPASIARGRGGRVGAGCPRAAGRRRASAPPWPPIA